jgi:ABC-type branched-subunit amino acid transport system permease subunit
MLRLDRRAADLLVWLLLLTMPFWLPAVGGYTQLGSRVVILALAAMSLNFLLGYTGVLSFGHAAYFGLGVYGTGLTIKFLMASTLAGMAGRRLGRLRGGMRHRGADRAPARHLFRDGNDRVRPSVLFHRLSLEQRDRRR